MKNRLEKEFNTNKNNLWKIITNKYEKFRGNILKVDILDETNFIEYTRENIITKVEVTEIIPYKKYKANIENQEVKGYFIINLKEISPNKTKMIFEIDVKFKSMFKGLFLKKKVLKEQNNYIRDLVRRLNVFNLDIEKINNIHFKDDNK